MQPFLKQKERMVAGLIVKTRTPDEKPEQDQDVDDSSAAIEACASALIDAIHAKDVKRAADAIKDAFDILSSTPETEDSGVEPHSYEAQNRLAAHKE